MKKIFYGSIAFLTILLLSKYGTTYTTDEFLFSLLEINAVNIGTLAMPIIITILVINKTDNNMKKISVLNILSIIFLGLVLFMSFNVDDKRKLERIHKTKPSFNDLLSMTRQEFLESYDHFGGNINEYISRMAKGANKSAKQNNGYITIDSTGSFVSANARGNYFVLKGIIGKQAIAEEIKKIINNDKVTTKDIFKQLKNPKFNKLIMTDTKKINTKIFCSVPVFRLLMEKNMIMDFLFLYDDGDIVGSFTIDNNDCIKNNVQAKAIK